LVVFEVLSKLEKTVRLDEDRWKHILEHPEMANQLDKLKETLINPDEVRRSTYDTSVWLFHKLYTNTPITTKYLLVAIKVLNEEGFIVTAFFTDKMKRGKAIWRRKL